MAIETVLATGPGRAVGEGTGRLTNTFFPGALNERKLMLEQAIPNHDGGMHLVISLLTDRE